MPMRAAMWRFNPSTTIDDPGAGRLRYDTATPISVTAIALAAHSADGQDVAAWIGQWNVGTPVTLQVQYEAATHADYVLDATPLDSGTWWHLVVHATTVNDPLAALAVQDQAIVVIAEDSTSTAFVVGDLAVIAEPYQLVPGGARALTVATTSDATLLLCEDGTAGWFKAEDLTAFRVAKAGHKTKFEAYEYESDLDLDEDWRGGYFDQAWT